MCQNVSRFTLVALALLGGVAHSSVALACTTVPSAPTLDGEPRDGATDVPTDVIPYYGLPLAVVDFDEGGSLSSTFTLVSAEGEAIALQTRAYGEDSPSRTRGFELRPERALRPNTSYVLTAKWDESTDSDDGSSESVVRFTTGAGPLAEPPAAPAATLRHIRALEGQSARSPSSCDGSLLRTCVDASADVLVEAVYIDSLGQEHSPAIARRWFETNLTGVDQGTDFRCVRLRTRAANGTYSEPVQLCGADFGEPVDVALEALTCKPADAREPEAAAPSAGASTDAESPAPTQGAAEPRDDALADIAEEPGADGDGCSVSGRNASSSLLGSLLALATLLSFRARRRRV